MKNKSVKLSAMSIIKNFVKKIPIVPSLYRNLRDWRLRKKPTKDVFLDIYQNNKWNGADSVSGQGSDAYQTRIVIEELPVIFNELNVLTMLDIPCGDFHWMQNVELNNLNYIGADIVGSLIANNSKQYKKDNISFQHLDLIQDPLPKVDLVFCRDCLVHLSFADINNALHNICQSNSKYLLTTTFINREDNDDIATGNWRTLNLEIPPFSFPRPIKIINEGCTEGQGLYTDKSLGLWKITDLKKFLAHKTTN